VPFHSNGYQEGHRIRNFSGVNAGRKRYICRMKMGNKSIMKSRGGERKYVRKGRREERKNKGNKVGRKKEIMK
jgi:hypothetical protein